MGKHVTKGSRGKVSITDVKKVYLSTCANSYETQYYQGSHENFQQLVHNLALNQKRSLTLRDHPPFSLLVNGRCNSIHTMVVFSGDHSPLPEPLSLQLFETAVRAHYSAHQRKLPWRETSDPYAIMVSEVMLQQTGVERVRSKYPLFLDRFPDVSTLADSPLQEVLLTWQGLGYNRRAVALQKCAKAIMEAYDGKVPDSVDALQKLPGIGPYTARAIAAFAFGKPFPFIETNIRSAFLHWFFADRNGIKDEEIIPLIAATLDMSDPRSWYYALMDYGAMLKGCRPNPGRRSAHYTRQSPFKGSNRELRSRILRLVMDVPGLPREGIAERLKADTGAVEKNLALMTREGLLRNDGDGYFV